MEVGGWPPRTSSVSPTKEAGWVPRAGLGCFGGNSVFPTEIRTPDLSYRTLDATPTVLFRDLL